MSEPWTRKHRPKTLSEVAGNKKAKDSFAAWLESWSERPPSKKAALLHGPAGTGKTVTAEAAGHDLGYDIIEVNASDRRSAVALARTAGSAATEGILLGRKRLVLLDEIDGINLREDAGAVATVVKMIGSARFPLVLTANDVWNPKIRSLRSRCLLIEFRRLGVRETIPYLEMLCRSEGVEADPEALRVIHDRNKGDMRSMINDLQTALAGRKKLALADVEWLGWRDRKEPIFSALSAIFSSKECMRARRAVDLADINYEMLYEWIYENAPLQLTDAHDLAQAMDFLARADIYLATARRTQAWRLLPYALDLMTAGVAMSKVRTKPAWTPMRFPHRIMRLSTTKGVRAIRDSVGAKIGSKTHVSTRVAVTDVLPYLRIISKNDSRMASQIAEWLKLDSDMTEFLKGGEREPKAKRRLRPAKRRVSVGRKSQRRKASSA